MSVDRCLLQAFAARLPAALVTPFIIDYALYGHTIPSDLWLVLLVGGLLSLIRISPTGASFWMKMGSQARKPVGASTAAFSWGGVPLRLPTMYAASWAIRAALGLSGRKFLRHFSFKAEMGSAPHDYPLRLLLDRCRRLRVETRLPVDANARRCGVSSGGRLARAASQASQKDAHRLQAMDNPASAKRIQPRRLNFRNRSETASSERPGEPA